MKGRPIRIGFVLLTTAAMLLSSQSAAAGSFGIAPTRLVLSGSERIAVLTLHNQADVPALLQARAVAWSQQDGTDHLEETRDLLLAPPVFNLPAGSEQVIRVALRRAPDSARELSYRVVVQEVPQRLPAAGGGLRIALQLSIPVFVIPTQATAHPEVNWVVRRLPSHEAMLEAVNSGAAHVQIQRIQLQLGRAAGPLQLDAPRYLLAGSRATWRFSEPPGQVGPTVQLQGTSDLGEFTAKASVAGP